MADSTSDSGSVQSLQSELIIDKKTEAPTRFYTCYLFYPKRIHSTDAVPPADTQEQQDGSLSLNILATNLAAAAETDLRTILAQKLAKSLRQMREENYFVAQLSCDTSSSSSEKVVSASCYYCQICAASDDFEQILPEDQTEGSRVSEGEQFIVCFISFLEDSLYLFHSELEQYIQGIAPLLDKELPQPFQPPHHPGSSDITSPDQPTDQAELNQLATGIRNYLEQWPCHVLEFLPRTLHILGLDVQYLLYSALLNASLEISGATSQQEDDIRRFYSCCSLSEFLEPLQPERVAALDTSEGCDLWHVQPVVVDITFQPGQGVTFDNKYVCKYCSTTAEALTSMNIIEVSKMRESLEAFKLRFVRNLNTFKRHLKKAEIDHYALYRSLSFLKVCNCGDLLLRYVKLDAGMETLQVVTALETFIKDVHLKLP